MEPGKDINRFAPPKSEVKDVAPASATAPPMWNPNAAANWSFLLTPAFGAYLQMKNWQALGDEAKAAQAKMWAWGSVAFIVLVSVMSVVLIDSKGMEAMSRSLGFALLFAWYFANGRAQVQLVKARYGKTYPRRGWTKPLLIALGAYVGFIVVVALVTYMVVGDKL